MTAPVVLRFWIFSPPDWTRVGSLSRFPIDHARLAVGPEEEAPPPWTGVRRHVFGEDLGKEVSLRGNMTRVHNISGLDACTKCPQTNKP